MKLLTIAVSIAPTLSFVHLKTSAFTSTQIASTQTAPTQTAVANTPINENWWKPDLSIEQDLGHAHGDNSARSLEVTGFSKAPLVPRSPPSSGFGQVASAGSALGVCVYLTILKVPPSLSHIIFINNYRIWFCINWEER